ncbi:MAG: glycosyltransferase family 2 protein [Bryobacterales bacterium]|nr:glycosyltransferase family 2 protein [Bryobacterales bacterium]MBV9401761.1 glycosyltransferase family 2 protein [Bryobacterales bacterium]
MAHAIFWAALTCVLYVYFGYPLLLVAWSRLGRRQVKKRDWEPSVSLLIVMHNESKNVRGKLSNCLDLDYPKNKLQIIVSLDAPTDDTEALAREYSDAGVAVMCSHVRRGKAGAINSGMTMARGQIVVFADARQRFARNAVRELVANFADPSVGAVSGELMLMDGNGREASNAVGLYWRYEKAIRSMESDIHSVPGASGSIYAIRRELFRPLPGNTFLDDVTIPMRIVLSGKRAIFDSKARAYDCVTETPEQEYEKKVRTLTGNYELFAEMPQLLLPWRNPIFIQMVSHKAGRLIVPHCLGALFAANLFLLHGFYLLFFAGQLAWYGLAVMGWISSAQRFRRQAAPAAIPLAESRKQI